MAMQDRVKGFLTALLDRLEPPDPTRMGHPFEAEKEILWVSIGLANNKLSGDTTWALMDHLLVHQEDRLPGVRTDGQLVYVHRDVVREKYEAHRDAMDSAQESGADAKTVPEITAWLKEAFDVLLSQKSGGNTQSSVCSVMTDAERKILSEDKHKTAVTRWKVRAEEHADTLAGAVSEITEQPRRRSVAP